MKHDCDVFLGFELIGHITKTLYAEEISCGLRCLEDEKMPILQQQIRC